MALDVLSRITFCGFLLRYVCRLLYYPRKLGYWASRWVGNLLDQPYVSSLTSECPVLRSGMKYVSKMNVGARFLNFSTYLCVSPVVCSCRCVKMERDRQAGVPDASSRLTCVIVYSPPLVSWNRDWFHAQKASGLADSNGLLAAAGCFPPSEK